MDNLAEGNGVQVAVAERARRSGKSLELTRGELPWLPEKEQINLVLVRAGGDGKEFLYGSAIRGHALRSAADQLDEHRSQLVNNLFYTHLPDFIEGRSAHISVLTHERTPRKIYYVGNPGGQRGYFIRFDNLEGKPVIIRVAVCDKSQQLKVLEVLTTMPPKFIKKLGKL